MTELYLGKVVKIYISENYNAIGKIIGISGISGKEIIFCIDKRYDYKWITSFKSLLRIRFSYFNFIDNINDFDELECGFLCNDSRYISSFNSDKDRICKRVNK